MSTCALARRCALEAWKDDFGRFDKVCLSRNRTWTRHIECDEGTLEEGEKRLMPLLNDLI